MSNLSSLIWVVLLLGGLSAAAWYLRRHRDHLARHFNQGPIAVRGVLNIGDGSRLVLVEVKGVEVLCGIGRNGVSAMQIIDKTYATESAS